MTESAGSILLLDDDKFLLDMYSMKFVKEGFTVQTCLATSNPIDLLSGGLQPDVVLFDIVMPEQDGFAFLQSMRDKHLAEQAIKIALSNQSTDVEKKKAVELGADEFVQKATMIPSEVVHLVKEVLKKR